MCIFTMIKTKHQGIIMLLLMYFENGVENNTICSKGNCHRDMTQRYGETIIERPSNIRHKSYVTRSFDNCFSSDLHAMALWQLLQSCCFTNLV